MVRGALGAGSAGFIMGLASVVPGLSAGTVAVVMGVYPQLLESLGRLRLRRVTALALGWLIGALVGVRTVGWGLDRLPDHTAAFLLGIVMMAALGIWRRHPPRGAGIPLGMAAFVLTWILVPVTLGGGISSLPLTAWELITSGVASGGGMILPGFSGATALVLMGVYPRIVGLVGALDWMAMFLFGFGAVLGVLATAALLLRAYESREDLVFALLGGLTGGSLRALVPGTLSPSVIGVGAAGLLLGLALGGFRNGNPRERGRFEK